MMGGTSIEELEGTTSQETHEAMGFGEMNEVESKLSEDVIKALGKIDQIMPIVTGSMDANEKVQALRGIRNELISGNLEPKKAVEEAEKLGTI